MQDSPDAKKPCKGILKTSSSFDKPGASYRKSAKFDELNVLQTYHPLDKDYGHMKIDEPKTPFNYAEADPDHTDQLDADLLAEKLRIAANTQTPAFGADDNLSDDEFPETEEEKVRRLEFERRRKAHYNEYEAVRLARKLIEEELADDDENDEEATVGEEELGKSEAEFRDSCDEIHVKEKVESQTESLPQSQSGESNTPTSRSLANVDRSMDVDQQFDPSHSCVGRE